MVAEPILPTTDHVALGRTGVQVVDWRWAALALAILHVAVWTGVGVVSRTNLDLPGDMVEAYAWGQSFEWGYYKHPPLEAWVAGAWFSVFPEGHLGFALLAALNTGIALLGVAALARQLLPADWSLACVAATAVTPGVTTVAMRFNANAILVATWPWAAALFVRMMREGRLRDAVACGLCCALAMLGKYFSIVLLIALLAASVALPAWRRRYASPLPWVAAATCIAALLPHAAWLLGREVGPLQYARAAASQTAADAALRAIHFGLSQWAFPVLAFGLLAFSVDRPDRKAAARAAALSIVTPRRDVAWLLGAVPIVVTMAGTMMTGARSASVWGIPISGGVAVLAASRARATGARLNVRRCARLLLLFWAAVGLLAPLLWYVAARSGAQTASLPREELALALEHRWQALYERPLPWVAGTRATAQSVSFYGPSHARYWSLWDRASETPWVDTARVWQDGGVIVCDADDEACAERGAALSVLRSDVAVAKHARGFDFAPKTYVVFLLPPRAEAPEFPG